jgi:Uma2 family endonuclease
MVDFGILNGSNKLELIDGHLVAKMPQNTPHRASVVRLSTRLPRYLPDGWWVMPQCPLEVGQDVPEPDGAVLREADSDYGRRDPTAADCGLVIEVSDSSLRDDRRVKAVLYAEAGIPTYWIVNVDDRRVEVYSQPTPSAYRTRTDYAPGLSVPLVLDGTAVASIAVADLLP